MVEVVVTALCQLSVLMTDYISFHGYTVAHVYIDAIYA